MIYLILNFFLNHQVSSLSISLIFSPYTPSQISLSTANSISGELTALFEASNPSSPLIISMINTTDFQLISNLNTDIFLDFSFVSKISQFLALQALLKDTLHIIPSRQIDQQSNELPSANTIYTDSSLKTEASIIKGILDFYKYSKIGIIYDFSDSSIQEAWDFKTLALGSLEIGIEIMIDNEYKKNPLYVDNRVSHLLKFSGIKVFVLLTSNIVASLVLKSADVHGLGNIGHVWVLGSRAMNNIEELCKDLSATMISGEIGVVRTGALGLLKEDWDSINQNDNFRLYKVLKSVFRTAQTSPVSASSLLMTLKNQLSIDQYGQVQTNYLIFNVVSYKKLEIGRWDYTKGLTLSKTVTWPGGLNSLPPVNCNLISLAVIYPPSSNDSLSITNAFNLAIEEINNSSYIGSSYYLKAVFQSSPSPSLYSVKNSIKRFESQNVLGYIGPYNSDTSRIYAELLSKDVLSKPIVSYSASSGDLSDSSKYSSFLRLIQQDGYQATAIGMLLNKLGVKYIGVIYSNDIMGQTMYQSLIGNLAVLQINILNKEQSRGVVIGFNQDGSLSQTCKQSVNEALSEIVKLQIKIIVYIGNDLLSAEIAKWAYYKELYGINYAWFGSNWINDEVFEYIDQFYLDDKENIMKVFENAFTLSQKMTQGSFGSVFSDNFYVRFKMNCTDYAMLAYDAVYLYAKAIKELVSFKQDYHDGTTLLNTLRQTYFIGASGVVQFRTDSNDRLPYGYNIMNIQNRQLVQVYMYDPQSIINLVNNSYPPMKFYFSYTCPPDIWPETYNCPFSKPMSKVSVKGVSIVISIGMVLFLITLYTSFYSYKKWKQIKIVKINQPIIRSWKDNLVQAQIVIEFFQFIAIAPQFQSLSIVITTVSNVFMLDLLKVAGSSKQDYWYFLIVICCLCYFWFVVVLIISTNAEQVLLKNDFMKKIVGLVNSAYLPFIGNTMFLPFFSYLFDAFVCDHEALGQPYVLRDCYMTCWGYDHLPYMIISGMALICYEPIAVFLRPLWQQAKTGLNIKIQPFFLLLKTCFQVLLVSVSKSLQGISPLANGIVFIIIFVSFGIATFMIKPFNYSRYNLWELSSIIAICYFSILATVSTIIQPDNLMWFIALIVGWVLIFGGTFIVQKKYMPDYMLASVRTRRTRSFKDIFGSNKVMNFTEFDQNKSLDRIEALSDIKIENLNEVTFNKGEFDKGKYSNAAEEIYNS